MAQHDWRALLVHDGFQYAYTRGDKERWTRPGKSVRQGISVDVHLGLGLLYCFTSSVPQLRQNHAYTLWAYEVAMRYGGDFQAAAQAKTAEGYGSIGRYAKEHTCSVQAAARALQRDARRRPWSRGTLIALGSAQPPAGLADLSGGARPVREGQRPNGGGRGSHVL
jgi:hypothetical protein